MALKTGFIWKIQNFYWQILRCIYFLFWNTNKSVFVNIILHCKSDHEIRITVQYLLHIRFIIVGMLQLLGNLLE
jgi:hypothetical protein